MRFSASARWISFSAMRRLSWSSDSGGGDFLVVLADAGIEFGFPFVIECHAAFGGNQGVAVLVEAVAEFGEFAFVGAGIGAGVLDGFFLGGKLHFKFGIAHFEAADRGQQFIPLGGEFDKFPVAEVAIEYAGVGGECLVAAGLGDLAAE